MINKIWKISVLVAVLLLAATVMQETTMNAKADSWTQTTQTSFDLGEKIFVETQTSPGDIKLDRSFNLPWTSIGDDQADADFGHSVASAGDVNGDGYDDVIIGAHLYDTTNTNAGKAYLYLGSSSGLKIEPSWTSSGDDQAGAYFGHSVASADDVNGDGYSDVIISACLYDTANNSAGKAYLYLGSSSGLEASPSWTSSGDDQSDAHFGTLVASADDVNGDGYSDVIIGAEFYDTANGDAGKAYLYLGSSSGLETLPSWTSSGDDQSGAEFGISVAGAGDVNGDGYSDVIIGAWRYDTANGDAGKAYLYLGSSSGLETLPSWTSTRNITIVDK
jgi:hypothetical protein